MFLFLFFFNDTATTEIYTLSLHDALPICADAVVAHRCLHRPAVRPGRVPAHGRLASDLRAPAVLPAPVVFCPACRRGRQPGYRVGGRGAGEGLPPETLGANGRSLGGPGGGQDCHHDRTGPLSRRGARGRSREFPAAPRLLARDGGPARSS